MRLASTVPAIGLLAMAGVVTAASVTVHSDGSSGDFASIGQALAHVQGESPGPGNPDVITILDEGPFREGALVISGDAHSNDLTIRAAEGVRPIVVSTHTGANAIELRKNGRAEVHDLIIIPAANISQTALRAILYHAPDTGSTGYDYHLENILISSNNGNDRPVASLDGLGSPLPNNLKHVSFRGDGGIRGNSTDEIHVYRMTLRDVVVSSLRSPAPYGLRSFHDGAAGSELIIGEGCVFSRIRSTTSEGAAINLGGMEGTAEIGRIQGSEERPVLIVNNEVNGILLTGSNAESNVISNAIIAANKGAAILLTNPRMDTSLVNVTIGSNTRYALWLANLNGSALNYEGTVSATNTIFAGNGSTVISNSIAGTLSASGTLLFEDSALVATGPFQLNRFYANGINVSGPGTVSLTRTTGADPRFISLRPSSPHLAWVTNEAYATAGPEGEPLRGGGRFGGSPDIDGFAWYFHN